MNNMTRKLRAGAGRMLAAALAAWLGPGQARAIDFNVPAGDWNVETNWTNPAMIPVAGSNAYVFGNRKVTISTPAEAAYVGIGKGTAGAAEIVDGASLTADELYLRDKDWLGGDGYVTQSGGAVTLATLFMGQGGVACYTQQAGVVRVTGVTPKGLVIGRYGNRAEYVMQGGLLHFKDMVVEYNANTMARFVQYGGTVSNESLGHVYLGYATKCTNAYYCQYGGTSFVNELVVGRNIGSMGHCIVTNGVLRAQTIIAPMNVPGAVADVQVSGSGVIVADVIRLGYVHGAVAGGWATNIWTQTGGAVTNLGDTYVSYYGNNEAFFTLGGGEFQGDRMFVGNGGGAFVLTQTGGTMRLIQDIEIPYGPTRSALWSMQNGTFTARDIMLGRSGGSTGQWDIAGGTIIITNLYVGYGFDGSTAPCRQNVSLSGGLLSATHESWGYNTKAEGSYTVDQSGGTHTVAGDLVLARNHNTEVAYRISGGQLAATRLHLGSNISVTNCHGRLHVVGMAPQVEAGSLTLYPATKGSSTLELTLDRDGGMRPIAVSGTATLNGILSIGLTNNVKFDPGTVVTVMTYNAKSGAFVQTNLLDGLDCQVNVLDKMITLDKLKPSTQPETIMMIR